MHQKFINVCSERNYLTRYSALPHFYDFLGDSSQLFIVQFLNEIGQVLHNVNCKSNAVASARYV
jgi:hypothetical protein